MGKSATDAKPTARDSLRYGPDGARYLKKSEWAVKSGNTTTREDVAHSTTRARTRRPVTVDGDTVRAHPRLRFRGAREDDPREAFAFRLTAAFEYAHRLPPGLARGGHGRQRQDADGARPRPPRGAPQRLVVATHADADRDAARRPRRARLAGVHRRSEHLDRTGLIHMNGRLMDVTRAWAGSSAPDPVVGDPTSSHILEPVKFTSATTP